MFEVIVLTKVILSKIGLMSILFAAIIIMQTVMRDQLVISAYPKLVDRWSRVLYSLPAVGAFLLLLEFYEPSFAEVFFELSLAAVYWFMYYRGLKIKLST